MFNLYPYQKRILQGVNQAFTEHKKVLVVCPTGSGKTVIFSNLSKSEVDNGGRVLILAHREELLGQAQDKLVAAAGLRSGLEKADDYASLSTPCVVGSVQSLARQARLNRWPKDHFSLLVVDEAHHTLADSYKRILEHFDTDARVLGVTATPDRGDKKNLGSYYDTVGAEILLTELIADGYLSPILVKSLPIKIDLTSVRTVAGDYRDDDLDHALDPYLPQLAAAVARHAAFRRTLVFTPLCATSEKFVAACRNVGLKAEHIQGDSPNRAELLAGFRAGEFDILSNASLLNEGYDDPGIDAIVVLRPTRIRSLYAQMVGRGTRIAPDKENLLLLDFLWLTDDHSLIHPAHLVAKNDDEAQEISEALGVGDDSYGNALLGEDLLEAVSDVQAQREAKIAKRIRDNAHRNERTGTATSDEYAINVLNDPAIVEFEPTFKWESLAATPKQLEVLANKGIDTRTVRSRGHASRLLDAIFRKDRERPATEAQQWAMARGGHPDPWKATAAEARAWFAARRKAP